MWYVEDIGKKPHHTSTPQNLKQRKYLTITHKRETISLSTHLILLLAIMNSSTQPCAAELLRRIERLEKAAGAIYLSTTDFANKYGLNHHTVRTMIQRGRIPAEMIISRSAGLSSCRHLIHSLPAAHHLGLIQ